MNRLLRELTVLVAAFGVAAVFGWALGKGLGSNSEVAAGGGGATSNVIALTANDRNRLYLIDTTTKVILVYEMSSTKSGFTMVAGRKYEWDLLLAQIQDLPFAQRKYSLPQIKLRYERLQRR